MSGSLAADIVAGITRNGGAARSRRRCLAAATLTACSVLAVACGSGGSGSTSTNPHSPVKVGYLLPLTGIFTKNGISEQNGFKLGLKHFGTSVGGHPIQVTYANDQGDPSVSLSDARQLVTSDHVQVVEGPLISSAIAVVAPYVLGQGIPEDDLYLASPQQSQSYTRYGAGFTSGWDGFAPTTVGARWAYNTMHWRHVTTVGLGISFGWQGIGGFASQFTKLGGKIDKMIWVPSNSVDMSSYVSAIPASTQAVFVVLSGSQAANFVNSYASFGLKKKIPLMGITTLTDQAALPAENGPAAAGIYTDAQYCDGNRP
jgi:branched-chain amino acid transport system substrate-binding protein